MHTVSLLKKLTIIPLCAVLFFSQVFPVWAVTDEIIETTISDFLPGDYDDAIDIQASPGDIQLKQNLTSTTLDSYQDFASGYSQIDSTYPMALKPEGSVTINQGYVYNPAKLLNISLTYQNVSCSEIDEELNLVFLCTNGAGIIALDTQGTYTPDDDSVVFNYTTTTTPSITNNSIIRLNYHKDSGLIFINTYNGFSVIDMKKTKSASDDVVHRNYTSSSLTGFLGTFNYSSAFDSVKNIVYVSVNNYGIYVIDMNTNTIVGNYKTTSIPSISGNSVFQINLDISKNRLTASTNTGITVIDTNGTAPIGDDTKLGVYDTTTFPAIGDNFSNRVLYNDAWNYVYMVTDGGLTLIDTKGTPTLSDDEVIKNYNILNTPEICGYRMFSLIGEGNLIYVGCYQYYADGYSIIDTKGTKTLIDDEITSFRKNDFPSVLESSLSDINLGNDSVYLGSGRGLIVMKKDTYNSSAEYISKPMQISSLPTSQISWTEISNSDHSVKLQYRVGNSSAMYVDEFDDNVPNVSYPYVNYRFNNVSEAGELLKLSNPAHTFAGYFNITNAPVLQANQGIIRSKARFNTSIPVISLNNTTNYPALSPNQWIESTNAPQVSSFTFYSLWQFGTWNNTTDSIEVDSISYEKPDSEWGTWSDYCTNSYYCPIDQAVLAGNEWIQYKLSMTTADASTAPEVTSVSFSKDYQQSGEYLSKIIDAGTKVSWSEVTIEADVPTGTSVIIQYRFGDTPEPDASWIEWQEALSSNSIGRYFQYRIILSTDSSSFTPKISAVIISYSPAILNRTGSNIAVLFLLAVSALGLVFHGKFLKKFYTNSF